ncbi:TIGR02302 family protein [Sagittula sp. M10.9X]|uniref:TIGR02302 family protein n=2 Tax=Sagittula salina TaxID=2820268 RepID=A0A940MR67_9RHOB|nr:TIGR02302 family protein [Sagittula salina]
MVAEQLARAFWPLWTVAALAAGALILGLQDIVPVEVVWATAALAGLLALGALVWGVRRFRWPSRPQAMQRVDQTMAGRPFQAVMDRQVIGADDAASTAVWQAHRARMIQRLREARPVRPDLRQNRADPFALRYVAVLVLSVALLFGSFGRVQSVTNMGLGAGDLAQGPAWEGWMQPPAYTRLPSVYLNDITAEELTVPEGAKMTLRMYGQVGSLTVEETVSGREEPIDATATAQDFEVLRSGRLAIDGPGGRAWQVTMLQDSGPSVTREGEIETSYEGETKIPFHAMDDYGVVAGVARISLNLDTVDRSWGRTLDPEPREVIEVPLPMPVAGDRSDFVEPLVANFSLHPWANLPVRFEFEVEDARGQSALSQPEEIVLPGRRFFDPVAAALVEERQALLWNRDYAGETAMILRAILNRSEDLFRKDTQALTLRRLMERIEAQAKAGMTDEAQAEITQALWDLALELEEGDLEDARQRMQRAQERLEEAMKNGASDQEIAELMHELREATRDYMRQLAQEQAKRGEQQGQQADPQDMMEMSQDDIQRMMDRIQELMEQGRMAEAQEAMRQLQEMLDNMQMTEGQGQGQSPGEQAMEGLSETLRDQQQLSDEAFRELNEGQQGQQGQQEGQHGPFGDLGQQGQQGQGQQPGQSGEQQGQEQQGQGQQGTQSLSDSLAERQRALRDELNRQRQNLPGQGSEAGERAGEALGRAEDAMDGSERALRDGRLGEAIDQQSQALEALREGMRSLGEALADQQQGQQRSGQQGFAEGGDPQEQRDPLGRNSGTSGRTGTDEGMLQGEDVYRRAEELLGELRKRSGETDRPEVERDYLDRLLERF